MLITKTNQTEQETSEAEDFDARVLAIKDRLEWVTRINTVGVNKVDCLSDMKEDLVGLLMACAVLPMSKVEGRDLWCQKVEGRSGLKGAFEKQLQELKDAGATLADIEEVFERYRERLQKHLAHEDELDKNAEVDDLAARFEEAELNQADYEYRNMVWENTNISGVADEAQKRHERMVVRIAIVRKIQAEKPENMDELLAQINDDLAERILNKEQKFDTALKPFVITKQQFRAAEVEVLRKNQASHFKSILEKKACVLRTMSKRAQILKKTSTTRESREYVTQVIKHCNHMMRRMETLLKMKGQENKKKPMAYSMTSLMALWNEAARALFELGVFKVLYPKKMKGVAPFFDEKPTGKGMVEMKTGADWADEIRNLYYETDDGTGRTPVRSSGVDG